jgi:NAD dependent epimerase/dehydratase family enzyme
MKMNKTIIIIGVTGQDCQGIFNLTSPQPMRNKEFARILGKTLGRPSFLAVPSFVLKILLGEMAEQLLLPSQRVLPKRLKEAGFTFRFPHLEEALLDLLK